MSFISWFESLVGLTCTECCSCNPEFVFVTDKVSASKAKCGFSTFVASSPPKYFLQKITSFDSENTYNENRLAGDEENGCTYVFEQITYEHSSQTDIYDPEVTPCALSTECSGTRGTTVTVEDKTFVDGITIHEISGGTAQEDTRQSDCSWEETTNTDSVVEICRDVVTGEVEPCSGPAPGDCSCTGTDGTTDPHSGSITSSETVRTQIFSYTNSTTFSTVEGETCDITSEWTQPPTEVRTLSGEYTTAALIARLLAAIPSYDDDWDDGSPSASFSLAANEASAYAEKCKYKGRFLPTASGCLFARWTERFTPTTGSPTDTPQTFTWTGEIPEGFDPEDPETWIETGEYALDIPASNGTVSIVDLEVTCDCAGFPEE